MEHRTQGGVVVHPLAFAPAPPGSTRQLLPLWLSPPPPLGAAQTLWSKLPVGGDFVAQRETPVKGASHGFAALPLTGVSRCAFRESPTEQIAQRACSRHEPTGGIGGDPQNKNPNGALIHRKQCRAPRRGFLEAHGSITRNNKQRKMSPSSDETANLPPAAFLVSACWCFAPNPKKSGASCPAFFT